MGTVEIAFDVYETSDTRADLNPVIMMHGFLWNKYIYRELASELCKATNRKVFCLDLRNHGESPSTDDCSITLMIQDVKRFMQEQRFEKVAFVCHSFSNTIAYMIALEKPDAIEKMLMIDNPPFNDTDEEFNKHSVYPQLDIQNRLLKTLSSKMSLREAKAKFYGLANLGKKGQEYFYKKAAYDLRKENGMFRWKHDPDFLMDQYEKGLMSLTARGSSDIDILIIRCPNSGRVPDRKFDAVLRYNPKARLETFEDTTHLLMFEQPERFIEVARDFLRTSD